MSAAPVLASTLQDGGSAGYLALLLVVLIGLATVFLIRNMSGRLKRLPKQFDPPAGTPAQDEDADRAP